MSVEPSPKFHAALLSAWVDRPNVVAVPAVGLPATEMLTVSNAGFGVTGGSGAGAVVVGGVGSGDPNMLTVVVNVPTCAETRAAPPVERMLLNAPLPSVTPPAGDNDPTDVERLTGTPGTNAPLAVRTVAMMSRPRSGRLDPVSRIVAGVVLGVVMTGVGAPGA